MNRPVSERGVFRALLPFDDAALKKVPRGPGVYLLYKGILPFYVGRSRVDMRQRLWCHLHGCGSRKIAVEKKEDLYFEFRAMLSVEQAEAELIEALGTYGLGSLRRESDPADWV
jgi:hypothetical protein